MCEIPSGILSDAFSRRTVYLWSKFLIIAFFLIIYFAHGLQAMTIAWFIYGISAALDSGTIGNEIILRVRDHCDHSGESSAKMVDTLVRLDTRIATICMIISGFLGSFIYQQIGFSLYWFSLLGATICIVIIFICFPAKNIGTIPQGNSASITKIKHVFTEGLRELIDNKNVRIYFCALATTQIFFQSHFQFWQSFFLEIGMQQHSLGLLYVLFQSVSLVVSFVSMRGILARYKLASILPYVLCATVFCIILLLTPVNIYIKIFAYSIFVAIFWIISNDINAQLRQNLTEKALSTLTSLASMMTRIASIIVLSILSVLLHLFPVHVVIPLMFAIAMITTLASYLYASYKNANC
nr:MFS transporter [Lactobacillus iners]